MLVSDEEVSVLTRGAHTEVLDRLGRDFKTWKQNAWLWSDLSVEFFEKGTLPDDRDAALAAWKAQRPKTVFEFRCRMWAFRSERHDIRWTTACCLYAAPAFEHHVTAAKPQLSLPFGQVKLSAIVKLLRSEVSCGKWEWQTLLHFAGAKLHREAASC